MTLHAANHISRMPAVTCEHRRRGFREPARVTLPSGREVIVATCIGCGRAYYVLRDGVVERKVGGVHVSRYRRDRAGGERAHGGGPDSSVVMPERKER